MESWVVIFRETGTVERLGSERSIRFTEFANPTSKTQQRFKYNCHE